jgi:hypothetical protein
MKRLLMWGLIAILFASPCSADVKVSALPAGTVASTWVVVCEAGTAPTTSKCTVSSILALKIGTVTNGKMCVGDSDGLIQCTADVGTISGTPAQYQFGVWASATAIGGVAVTASKPVCTDANGSPTACTTLVVTGLIDGLTHIESANGKTIDKLSAYYIASGTSNFIVPTPSAAGGNQYCFKQANNATNAITVIPVHTSGVMLEKTDGTGYCTADDKLVSGGGKTDKLCIVALDATHYETFSSTGTWTCTAH